MKATFFGGGQWAFIGNRCPTLNSTATELGIFDHLSLSVTPDLGDLLF